MAGADYRSCDLCGMGKVFYDAGLNYEPMSSEQESLGNVPFKEVGEPACYTLERLGDWAVLCKNCAKTHKCVIVEI